jgi:hypothetical protein
MVATLFFRWEITQEDMDNITWNDMEKCKYIDYVIVFENKYEIDVFEKTHNFDDELPTIWNFGSFKGVEGFPVIMWNEHDQV